MVGHEYILEILGAEFSYNGKDKIFEDINFTFEEKDVLCILGPYGTGKSTLIKCINGLLKLDKGNILFQDNDIKTMSKVELAKIMGYVPQTHRSTFAFSVLDVVLLGRAPHLGLTDFPGEKDVKIARKSIKDLEILHLEDKPYTEISSGEIQLVILARVLTQQPKMLLLDEPTSHLDFRNQTRTLDIIKKISKSGLSVIMTSHYPDHAFISSNKVAILNKGKLMAIGDPEDVITEKSMSETYGSDVKILNVENHRKAVIPLEKY
jgi:iron complex transport system ATP-binding protein